MGKRKKPVWTDAMRKQAALDGARQPRESRQFGGLMSWCGKTPEEQAAVIERLRARRHTGKDYKSAEARAAQHARALAGMAVLSAKKAQFLADKGMLRKVPIESAAPVYAAAAEAERMAAWEAREERQAKWLAEMSGRPWDAEAWREAWRTAHKT